MNCYALLEALTNLLKFIHLKSGVLSFELITTPSSDKHLEELIKTLLHNLTMEDICNVIKNEWDNDNKKLMLIAGEVLSTFDYESYPPAKDIALMYKRKYEYFCCRKAELYN